MTKTRRDYTKHKHIAAAVGLIVLTALLQTTDGLFPRPFGAAAFLLIPAIVCCAMFENETPALLYGLLAGLLWDCANLSFNGYAIFLCVIGCAVSAIIRRKMRNTWVVALVLSAMVLFGYLFIIWIFGGASFTMLLRLIIPSFMYSFIFTPLYYMIFRAIDKRWQIRSLA